MDYSPSELKPSTPKYYRIWEGLKALTMEAIDIEQAAKAISQTGTESKDDQLSQKLRDQINDFKAKLEPEILNADKAGVVPTSENIKLVTECTEMTFNAVTYVIKFVQERAGAIKKTKYANDIRLGLGGSNRSFQRLLGLLSACAPGQKAKFDQWIAIHKNLAEKLEAALTPEKK